MSFDKIDFYFDNVEIYNLQPKEVEFHVKKFNQETKQLELTNETKKTIKLSFRVSCGKFRNKKLGYVSCFCWMEPEKVKQIDFNKRYRASFWAYFSNISKNVNGTWKNYTTWTVYKKFEGKEMFKLNEIKFEPESLEINKELDVLINDYDELKIEKDNNDIITNDKEIHLTELE